MNFTRSRWGPKRARLITRGPRPPWPPLEPPLWYCDVLVSVGFTCCWNLSKSAFFEGMVHFERKFQKEGVSPTNHCWCRKTGLIALSCGYQNIRSTLLGFVTKHMCDRRTDKRTESDRQTELRFPRPRAVKIVNTFAKMQRQASAYLVHIKFSHVLNLHVYVSTDLCSNLPATSSMVTGDCSSQKTWYFHRITVKQCRLWYFGEISRAVRG